MVNHAKVINLSLGQLVPAKGSPPPSLIKAALDWAYERGIVTVAAIGNWYYTQDYRWDFYPGVSQKALGVGATTCGDNRVTLGSGWGWESDYSDSIDLVAPGSDIWTNISPGTGFFNGTSASAPMVSGIVSLVITHRKKLIPGEVLAPVEFYEVLRHTGDDTVGHTYDPLQEQVEDTLCWDMYYGWGRANAYRALLAVSHGDANNDSHIDVVDVNYIINYLFKGGPPPVPELEMGDANCDKRVTISDTAYLINYLFKGADPPPMCYTDCSQP